MFRFVPFHLSLEMRINYQDGSLIMCSLLASILGVWFALATSEGVPKFWHFSLTLITLFSLQPHRKAGRSIAQASSIAASQKNIAAGHLMHEPVLVASMVTEGYFPKTPPFSRPPRREVRRVAVLY